MISLGELHSSPNALAPYYSAFRVSERLLLTGHSHQAWPDAGFEGQKQAWSDAAEFVDQKWDAATAKWARVGEGYRERLGGCSGDITLDSNTHALLLRFLSALPLRERPRIVTTDGEFHTVRRQVDRLAEEGIEVVKVAADPLDTLSERLADQVDDRTSCVLVSSVLFGTGLIVPELQQIAAACTKHGAEMMVDAYHSLGVVPFSLDGMEQAFVLGGGYKYMQLGEGNCFMRVPEGCEMRPVITGWFSEFAELADAKTEGEVRYGKGFMRFAGSTFDPTSQYRGAAVLDFFAEQGLSTELLRSVSQHQVGLLIETLEGLDLDPAMVSVDAGVPLESRAGFLAVRAPDAEALSVALREHGVSTDARGDRLRFGPAPYLSDAQVAQAMETLREVVPR
ncbi:MAG: aminotransferase class V-fold PLP-dependent enzyme [Longimicrobiales bacterium]|jgi:kynureninase